MNEQLNRLRDLESALSIAKQDLATFEATETAFRDYAGQNYRQNPNEATGFTHQTTPISESGRNYAAGIAKGWKLESIRPSQFALTFYWRTADLTDKQITANVKKLVDSDWQRKLVPLQDAVSYAQANLDQFKDDLRALTAAIA